MVSVEDYEWLNQFKWHVHEGKNGNNYALTKSVKLGKGTVKMHRVIMKITDPKVFIDHIDGDGLNNQRDNLRIATSSENGANRKCNKESTSSKYKGVSINNSRGNIYWRAACRKDYKVYAIYCTNEIEAAIAYNVMALGLHGEFARLNEITEDELSVYRKYKQILSEVEKRKQTHRICVSCNDEKELSQFIGIKRKGSVCKDCSRNFVNVNTVAKYRQSNRKIPRVWHG